jgi:hypothetical protein
VGISYNGRTYEEGKKIGWQDGFRAIYAIVKYNIFRRNQALAKDKIQQTPGSRVPKDLDRDLTAGQP